MKKIITTVYLLFLTFLVCSAVFASKIFDGDIRNSYEKGMAYPVEKEKIEKNGWSFSMKHRILPVNQQSNLEMLISGKDGLPVHGARVTMHISRLSQPYSLPPLQAEEYDTGNYGVVINLPFPGSWQVNSDIQIGEDQIHRSFKFYAEERKKK